MLYLLVASCVLLCAPQCHSEESCPNAEPGLEDKYIDQIVKKHNEFRKQIRDGENKHVPQAKEMPDLVWDKDLAAKAQAWADKCPKGTDEGRGDVGQIVITDSGKKEPYWIVNLSSTYRQFWNVKDESIDSYKKNSDSDGFTQLVWAKTTKVGCGYLRYQKDKRYDKYDHIYVCDYFPRGNIEGEPVYIRK